ATRAQRGKRVAGFRVGEIRVYYDVTGDTVEVLAIVAKSEAESWLAQFGKAEGRRVRSRRARTTFPGTSEKLRTRGASSRGTASPQAVSSGSHRETSG